MVGTVFILSTESSESDNLTYVLFKKRMISPLYTFTSQNHMTVLQNYNQIMCT